MKDKHMHQKRHVRIKKSPVRRLSLKKRQSKKSSVKVSPIKLVGKKSSNSSFDRSPNNGYQQ